MQFVIKRILLITAAILYFALSASAQVTFPERCLGVWEGKMLIYKEGAVKDSVDVRLTVARTKTPGDYTWRTDYLSKARPMTKDYTLRVKDAAKGHYLTDEGGGIELQEYVFGDKMYDVFETGGVMLTATYEIRGKELIFEVTAGKKIDNEKAGVTNYSVTSLQRVVFHRIRKR